MKRTIWIMLSAGLVLGLASTASAFTLNVPLHSVNGGPASGLVKIVCDERGASDEISVQGLDLGIYLVRYTGGDRGQEMIGEINATARGGGVTTISGPDCPIGRFRDIEVAKDNVVYLMGAIPAAAAKP